MSLHHEKFVFFGIDRGIFGNNLCFRCDDGVVPPNVYLFAEVSENVFLSTLTEIRYFENTSWIFIENVQFRFAKDL